MLKMDVCGDSVDIVCLCPVQDSFHTAHSHDNNIYFLAQEFASSKRFIFWVNSDYNAGAVGTPPASV